MRIILITIVILAGSLTAQEWISPAPFWRHTQPIDIRSASFDTVFLMSAGMKGNTYTRLFNFKNQANSIIKKAQDGLYTPEHGTEIAKSFRPLVRTLNDFYKLPHPERGEGYQLSAGLSKYLSVNSLIIPHDRLQIGLSSYQYHGWTLIFDQSLDQSLRTNDMAPFEWLEGLDTIRQHWPIGHPTKPITPGGKAYVDKLRAAGYSNRDAEFIAFVAENAGLDFNSPAADTFLSWVRNNLTNSERNIMEDDPYSDNQSGIFYRRLSLTELSVSYTLPLPYFFYTTVVFKQIRAVREHVFEQNFNNQIPSLNPYDSFSGGSEAFGFDASIMFAPKTKYPGELYLSLSGRNINTPNFKDEFGSFKLYPQFRFSGALTPFTPSIPFMVGMELDLNRVESLVLPGHHTQHFSLMIELNPRMYPFNFWMSTGTIKNIGDLREPWQIQLGTGIQLWHFTLGLSGRSSISSFQYSGEMTGYQLPEQFGLSITAGLKINW